MTNNLAQILKYGQTYSEFDQKYFVIEQLDQKEQLSLSLFATFYQKHKAHGLDLKKRRVFPIILANRIRKSKKNKCEKKQKSAFP